MINEVRLLGYVTKLPEMKSVSSGTRKTTMTIKTTESRKDSSGNTNYKDTFHQLTFWGDGWKWLIERIKDTNSQVYFEGKIEYSTQEVNGNKVYHTALVGHRLMVI